jgi:hypothetical protein
MGSTPKDRKNPFGGLCAYRPIIALTYLRTNKQDVFRC